MADAGRKRPLDTEQDTAASELLKASPPPPSACDPPKGSCEVTKRRSSSKGTQRKRDRIDYDATEYCCGGGLRWVVPYSFEHRTYAKGRWFGKELRAVLNAEFSGSYSAAYFEQAMKDGRVMLRDAIVPGETVIRNGDWITHTVHRHEPPVIDTDVEIVHEDEHVVVVNKPATVPVHPCGRYRFNSVTFILSKRSNPNGDVSLYRDLHVVHRLDRLVSGLLILAKHSDMARQLSQCISDHGVQKQYVARVAGTFPQGVVVVREPVSCLDAKRGIFGCSGIGSDAKPAETEFQLHEDHYSTLSLKGMEGTSLVLATPRTGRTHQIRVHLQFLGHPIANDPCYGGTQLHTMPTEVPVQDPAAGSSVLTPQQLIGSDCPRCNDALAAPTQCGDTQLASQVEGGSVECKAEEPTDASEPLRCACIWLHAVKYGTLDAKPSDAWCFEAPLPAWARITR